jgi:hypothetical protein
MVRDHFLVFLRQVNQCQGNSGGVGCPITGVEPFTFASVQIIIAVPGAIAMKLTGAAIMSYKDQQPTGVVLKIAHSALPKAVSCWICGTVRKNNWVK